MRSRRAKTSTKINANAAPMMPNVPMPVSGNVPGGGGTGVDVGGTAVLVTSRVTVATGVVIVPVGEGTAVVPVATAVGEAACVASAVAVC